MLLILREDTETALDDRDSWVRDGHCGANSDPVVRKHRIDRPAHPTGASIRFPVQASVLRAASS